MSNRNYSISKVATSDGETTVLSGSGQVGHIILTTDGTNDATVLLEDGTSEMLTLKADGPDWMRSVPLAGDITFTNQLDVTVTGTGAEAFILFRPIRPA